MYHGNAALPTYSSVLGHQAHLYPASHIKSQSFLSSKKAARQHLLCDFTIVLPLVSHKQLFPFGYFPTRVHLLQITICTSKEKSLSCVRKTGFQQRVERCVRDCTHPSPAEEGKQLFFYLFKPKQASLQ